MCFVYEQYYGSFLLMGHFHCLGLFFLRGCLDLQEILTSHLLRFKFAWLDKYRLNMARGESIQKKVSLSRGGRTS